MHSESINTQNVYKLWEQRVGFPRPANASDRSWQVKLPEKEPIIAAPTNPIFGNNPVRGRPNLTDRNLRRLTSKKPKAKVIYFGSVIGLSPDDVREAKNALKRRRKELRN